jgi:exodeoxyribonuclease V beta subunit
MKEFDLFQCPLKGSNLIEASAGTGKTYIITWLFLRLVVEQRMPINEILVVTFTEAATLELKSRTLELLRQASRGFKNSSSSGADLKEYLANNGSEETPQLLNDAIRSFDEAAIFTIHGFCRKALNENAFESGSFFDTEIIDDQEALVEEVVEDFWRKNFYNAAPELAGYAMDNKFTPENLKKSLGNYTEHPDLNIVPKAEYLPYSPKAFRAALQKARASWFKSRGEIEEIFLTANLKRNIYKKQDIPRLLKKMDIFSTSVGSSLSLFQGFEKFTASKLGASMNKGLAAPAHPFFRLCEELKEEAGALREALDRHLLVLKLQLFDFAAKELTLRKRQKNIRSFGDLLTDLRDPLKSEGRGEVLARAIRARFKAALIDEFQDTDPVQWEIFKTVFQTQDSVLFLIGDPKQAIYGFRGADVHAYLEAASKVKQAYTLGKNYRSEKGLVRAVNAVFSEARNQNPFVYEGIQYRPVLASEEAEKSALRINGRSEPSLQIWFLDRDRDADPQKAQNKGKAKGRIAEAVAAEAGRLISLGRRGGALFGERPLEPRDIAILVRTHKEARLSQEALKSLGIPSILESTGNLFDSPEAEEVQRILAAVMAPDDAGLVKAALATDILGVRGEELEGLEEDEEEWSAALCRFREYNNLWDRHGFMRMFRNFIGGEGVRRRLLKFPHGERRVTNLLHVSEVLHQKSLEKCLSMNGIAAWLAEQRDPDHPAREKEHELRLESDENAVKIVTIHKSKGLEYPIVFCPYLWGGSGLQQERRNNGFLFHDSQGRLTLALGPEEREIHQADAEKELLAENLRLCYVALTRAKHRCYLTWGGINATETSALAYLFHNEASPAEFLAQGAARIRGMADEEFLLDLRRVEEEGKGSIRISPLPKGPGAPPEIRAAEAASLSCRIFSGKVEEAWRISSFSSLAFNKPALADHPDRDATLGTDTTRVQEDGAPLTIFNFPRGAKAGNALHEIFEELDFMAKDPSLLVSDKLARYGYAPRKWSEPVCRMIRRVLETSLDPHDENLKLSRISGEDRINELEFYFPMRPISAREIGKAFQRHGQGIGDFPEKIGRLNFAPAKGFMKGFVDLVFQFDGRYYLADWKSNYLGDRVEDYHQSALRKAMEEEFYILQYHIYVVALDRYLALRAPGYNYETHFGGVYYIFLRGVDPDYGPEFGIFKDLPTADLVGELSNALGVRDQ